MKNPVLWLALVLSLVSVGVAAQAEPALSKSEAKAAPAAKRDTRCEPETGSRISRKQTANGECAPNSQPGRSYTQEDIKRTGEGDVREALRKLDPTLK